jgi:hypothetical protein
LLYGPEQYLLPIKPGFYVEPAAAEFWAAGEQITAAATRAREREPALNTF